MTLDEFISGLSDALGEPALWEDESVVLEFSDGVSITIEYDPDEDLIYLYSDIMAIQEKQTAQFAPQFLAANLFGLETGGSASLAYDFEEEKLVLWDKFPLSTGLFGNFQIQLTIFQEVVGLWRERIQAGEIGGQTPDTSIQSMNPNMMA